MAEAVNQCLSVLPPDFPTLRDWWCHLELEARINSFEVFVIRNLITAIRKVTNLGKEEVGGRRHICLDNSNKMWNSKYIRNDNI